MQPDEEVTKKILYWMEKLGLNQVIIILVLLRESIFKLPIKHAISYVFASLQTTWDDPRGRRK